MRTFLSTLDLSDLSLRSRRLLWLGASGAADDNPYAEADALLERAAGLSAEDVAAAVTDEDLDKLRKDLRAAGKALLAEPTDEKIAKATELRDAAKAVDGVIVAREEAAAELATQAQALLDELAADDGDEGDGGEAGDGESGEGDESGEGSGEGAGDDEGSTGDGSDDAGEGDAGADGGAGATGAEDEPGAGEKIAATGSPARTKARRPKATRPAVAAAPETEMVLRASANAPGVVAGDRLDSNEKIFRVFDNALRATGRRYRGPRIEIPLMTFGPETATEVFGEARTLGRDAQANQSKIEAVTSLGALRASGGICVAPPLEYDLPIMGTDGRPLRDSLARFGTPRGGARFLPPPVLTDVTGAVGFWTNDNDVDPGSDGPETKPCLVLDCPEETEEFVEAITQCLTIGNFRNQFFPEQVKAWTTLVGVSAARQAETRHLTKIGDESTQVAVTQVLGTTRSVLAGLDRRASAVRSHHRLDPRFPLRFEAPFWLLNNMITDLARELPGSTDERLAMSEGQIEAFFTVRHINTTWLLDGESGQVFADQTDGDLIGWPDEAITYLFVEGTWLHLDAGQIDFGLVRDSVLNATNDFQIFSEVFENVAFHGVPGTSARMAFDICPNGETAAAASTSGICLGGS